MALPNVDDFAGLLMDAGRPIRLPRILAELARCWPQLVELSEAHLVRLDALWKQLRLPRGRQHGGPGRRGGVPGDPEEGVCPTDRTGHLHPKVDEGRYGVGSFAADPQSAAPWLARITLPSIVPSETQLEAP